MKKLLSSTVMGNIKASARLANELGIGIEISRIPNFQKIDSEIDLIIDDINRDLDGFKGYKSLHAMFFDIMTVSKDPAIEAISRRRHEQSFKVGEAIGVKNIVFHSGNKCMKHKETQERFRDNSIVFWSEFIGRFEDAGITAVIENVHEPKSNMILDIIKGVNSPNLKCSLDTGHANLFSTEPDVETWIKAYGKYLHHMHIHNNFGENDSHFSLLNGSIEFSNIFSTLKQENLSPLIVFEIFKKSDLIESIEYFNSYFGEKACLKN